MCMWEGGLLQGVDGGDGRYWSGGGKLTPPYIKPPLK